MFIRDRLKQLSELGIQISTDEYLDIHNRESNKDGGYDILAFFEDGKEVCQRSYKQWHSNPSIKNAEKCMANILKIEGINMKKSKSVMLETHYVIDDTNKHTYFFNLPSRKYLNSKSP